MSRTRTEMPEGSREPVRLCLELAVAQGAVARLEAVLAAADIASVVLVPAGGRPLAAADVRPLVAIGQRRGAAVLVADDAALAVAVEADGVHLTHASRADEIERARDAVGRDRIVGAAGDGSRDSLMVLGEAGADYVALQAAPDYELEGDGVVVQLDAVGWWAEKFVVPCVALDVRDASDAAALASAGADFVSIVVGAGMTAGDAAERARAIAAVLAAPVA